MQNVIKKTSIALVLAFTFGFFSIPKVEAATQSTYFVDITGNGCGNNCSDFYRYLSTQGVAVSNTNTTNTTSNASTTNNSNTNMGTGVKNPTNYNQYPYQVYTPFGSNNSNNTGYTSGNTQYGAYNYVQYPYYSYSYFKDPSAKYDSYLAGQYQDPTYIYYGKDATEQMNAYKKNYSSSLGSVNGFTMTSPTYTNNYSSSGSGFTITSVR